MFSQESLLIHYAPFYNVGLGFLRGSDRAKRRSLFFLFRKREKNTMGRNCFRRAGAEKGADGRGLSIGFSKVVHQTSPRPCGGGKSVVNRPASAGGKACGQLPVDALPRPRRSGLSLFASFSLLKFYC